MIRLKRQTTREDEIARWVDYFGRQSDLDDLKERVVNRYHTGLKSEVNPENPKGKLIQTYTKGEGAAAVSADMVELVNLGFGNKISKALATLFSESGCTFAVANINTDLDLSDEQSVIDDARDRGGFYSGLVDCDLQSCQIGSSCLFLMWDDGLRYTRVSPGQVRVYFDDIMWTADGSPVVTDTKDLEQAVLVEICLGSIEPGINRYLAIFPRSEENPNGRYVCFSSADGLSIPDKDEGYNIEDGVIENLIDDKPANPLSWLANKFPDLGLPEFPLVIIDGNICDSVDVFPTTDCLYRQSLEIDVAISHILGRSQKQMVGTRAIHKLSNDADNTLPRSLDGDVSLGYGQELKSYDGSIVGSKGALEIAEKLMIHLGASYNVPDYMISSKDYTVEASSGVALKVKALGLIKDRENRIRQNKQQVLKIFDIEKSYLYMFSSIQEAMKARLLECYLSWSAGQLKLPEDKTQISNRIVTLIDKGVIDTVEGIKEYHGFATDKEAKAEYNKYRDRADEFPPLVKRSTSLGLRNVGG